MTKPRRKTRTTGQDAREIPNDNQIKLFFHCRRCLEKLPHGMSPRDWVQIEAGSTPIGMQVWCKRCEANIVHIDFEGCVHPANLQRSAETKQ